MLTLHYSTQPALPAQTRILVVDDAAVVRETVVQLLRNMGYAAHAANDGLDALNRLASAKEPFDVIMLDHDMPSMSGLEVLARLQTDSRFWMIPVVMQTDRDDPALVQQCIDAGAFYHVVKPVMPGVLASIIHAAVTHRKRHQGFMVDVRRQRGGMALLHDATMHFRTVDEAEDLAVFLASGLPESDKRVNCLAELLVNAVEHGLLGLGYTDKTECMRANSWRAEMDRRAALNEPSGRHCTVVYRRDQANQTATLHISDPGQGFDWSPYLTLSPERAGDNHGRGIARARLFSFPGLTYHGNGNSLTVTLPVAN